MSFIPQSAIRNQHSSYSPRLPIPKRTVAYRADFVADYSCEGSGGFAPRFPNTCDVSGCQCGLSGSRVCFHAECHFGLEFSAART